MKYRIQLKWKVITELTPQGVAALQSSARLFNLKGGKSFLRSIGGKIRTEYAPVVLEPTDVFHHALCKLRTKLDLNGKKFPYEIEGLVNGPRNRLNVTFHLYGRVLCITFSISEFDVDANVDLNSLQKLENHSNVSEFARQIVSMTTLGDRHADTLASLPKYYPAIHIISQTGDSLDWQRQMVALLTRHAMPNDAVVTHVLEKNQSIQVDHSLMLVDKQGIVAYVPYHAHATVSGSLQRFGNASSMLELAAILRRQLSKGMELPSDVLAIITSAAEAIPESVSAQRTWSLITKEFLLQSELQRAGSKPIPDVKQRLLIVTVTNVESQAVLNAFAAETGRSAMPLMLDGYVYKHLGRVDAFDVYFAISEMGSGGVGGSQDAVRKAITAIKPDAVFMVGIAFGIDRKKFSVGDILVSKQLLLYDLQRVSSDSTISLRGDRVPASVKLLNWVRHAALTWKTGVRVEPGLVLSGDKLIDNKDYRNELSALVPDALGGEMEGAGLYVACQELKLDWILIKAICDWADGQKHKNKSANQQKAASNAINFVLNILKSTPA